MVPMGDAKGTALALMVELLAAGLTGANFAAEASSYLDAEGPPSGTGQLILAFDPAAFGGDAPARFGLLAASIEAQPGARLPGMRRLQGAREGEGRRADDFRRADEGDRGGCEHALEFASCDNLSTSMPGLVPGIHVLIRSKQDVAGSGQARP